MRKNAGKRMFAVILAASMIGNTIVTPAEINNVYAQEADDSEMDDYTRESDVETDIIMEDESTVESISEDAENAAEVYEETESDVSDAVEETEAETEKASVILHISQTYEQDDSTDYDVPVTLKENSKIKLLISSDSEELSNADNELSWSILRAEKGTKQGTVNIPDGEDDWENFETVESSPYFTLEEDENVLSLVAESNAFNVEDNYDYYIRATLTYADNGTECSSVTTIPVLITVTESDEEQTESTLEENQQETESEEVGTETVSEETTENVTDEGLAEYVSEETEIVTVFDDEDNGEDEDDWEEETETPSSSVEEENTESENPDDYMSVKGFVKNGDSLTYTGGKITQNISIYYKGKLLKEQTDYVLTYKNNVNAAEADSEKAPSLTINMKGQYSGSKTMKFTISPREITEYNPEVYKQAISNGNSSKITVPTLYFAGKKLSANKDFECDYSSLPPSYESGSTYEYTINGKGNFTGQIKVQLTVISDKQFDFGTAAVTLDQKQYSYHGEALSEKDVKISSVKVGKNIIGSELFEYKVHAGNAGTGYVEVYPSEAGENKGYRGTKTVTIKVVGDRKLSDAAMGNDWKNELTYSQLKADNYGGIFQEGADILRYNGENLSEGTDYTVQYKNNAKVGNATVIFTGKGRYAGTLKKTYKIVSDNNLTLNWHDTDDKGNPAAFYVKGGASVDFELADNNGYVLKNKTDYTFNVKLNGATAALSVTGKGNYKGYTYSRDLSVKKGDLGRTTLVVADKLSGAASDDWKSSVTIKDINGKKLTAGQDYESEVVYAYDGMDTGKNPSVGTAINVTVKGINNYEGSSITGSYHIYNIDFGKLTVVIDAKTYTGDEVSLSAKDIHVYENKNDIKSGKEIKDCFEIVSYNNNIKTGNAKVTLRGVGNYGGTKTYSFKINPKEYQSFEVTSFDIDTTQIKQPAGTTYKIQLSNVKPENADYGTIEWESSNTDVASVDAEGNVSLKTPGMANINIYANERNFKKTCLVFVESDVEEKTPDVPYVTPQMYRTAKDPDDTNSFQEAICAVEKTENATVYIPAGIYTIDATRGVSVYSDMDIIMSPNAVIKVPGNSNTNYQIIRVVGSNVNISGGIIIGERYDHEGTKGEWGMGIGIYDATNVTVTGVEIYNCWGDGIYLGSYKEGESADVGCRNITIKDCNLHDNRRNNLSIVCAKNVTIDNCAFNNANGTDPQYGIDVETNFAKYPNEHITITNSTFSGNAKAAMGIMNSANDITLENCKIMGDFINWSGTDVTLRKCTIKGKVNQKKPVNMEDCN
jgi:hypothetical protein